MPPLHLTANIGRKANAQRSQAPSSHNDFDDAFDHVDASDSKKDFKTQKKNTTTRPNLKPSRKPSKSRKMGQESSMPLDPSVPPTSLKARDLDSVAKHIKSGNAKRIVVMSGAGISTSAGIPDFRSPGTGLYSNLARLNLPYAEAVFSIDYFRKKPEAFYTLAQELWPGKWRPTITHAFIALLHKKGLLLKHFTQNIDCLDREAGVPGEKVIEAHGSFATSRCIDCKVPYSNDELLAHIEKMAIPRCDSCKGLVKPDIVFFGEALPAAFFAARDLPREADLVIVLGSSLSVAPFSQLPNLTSPGVPRLLINNEAVGNLGSRADDVIQLGDCDSGIRKLAQACGWLAQLEEIWNKTGRKFGVDPVPKSAPKAEMSRDELLEDEVNKITQEVEETLHVTQIQTNKVMNTEARPKIQRPRKESQDLGHSRVKSVEEWKAEFLAKHEKDLKHESDAESGARERARITARNSPLPGYRSNKAPSDDGAATSLDGVAGEGERSVNPASLSTQAGSTQEVHVTKDEEASPPLFGWTDPDKAQANAENHGDVPGRNGDSITTAGSAQNSTWDDDDDDDDRNSLASLLKYNMEIVGDGP
ncbi:NAD-dependent histone deacetylase SIR2 like protein [Venturia nashicola]|uniref:NAD-dependent histone deacetylase SIR2 like protein n=1 Tax=Venturia nashicola TaxID=86259 RepID=A0A4Z1P1N6_9PEZI|nr:NAD-dependent histone deacetylase SIR2 like protein [Venturia nashicola]TLD35456.1 NAD-dependent histone deacetylase SIR2 like protein [Venturia nashicola]